MNSEKPINRPLNGADLEKDFPELRPLSFQMANFSETWHDSPQRPEIGFLGNCIVYSAVLHADGEVYQYKRLVSTREWAAPAVKLSIRETAIFSLVSEAIRKGPCKHS